MAITMRYWVCIVCDTCGKKLEHESEQLGADRLPSDWVQGTPPGERMMREFCSVECIGNWTPPPKPWGEKETDGGE